MSGFYAALAFTSALAFLAAGCAGAQLDELQRQVAQQKAQIGQQQRELEELRAQQQQQSINKTLPPPGSCDEAIMHLALAHGDQQYGSRNYQLALGYYQDAAKACPGKSEVELSLARVYEAMGDRRQAKYHYQLALNAAEVSSAAADQARQGIARLNSSR